MADFRWQEVASDVISGRKVKGVKVVHETKFCRSSLNGFSNGIRLNTWNGFELLH